MGTQNFRTTLYGEGSYLGDRFITPAQINNVSTGWSILNVNSDNRSVWGIAGDGWLQYRSNFGTYAGRYNEADFELGDSYFEVDIQPAGSGSYEVGFLFRFRDRLQTYYYLTWNGGARDWGGKNIRLMKSSAGSASQVADYATPFWVMGTTYRFRCEMTGNNFKIYLNGTKIIEWTDVAANASLKGAFGPYVLGQEFAKWRGFQTTSLMKVSVYQDFPLQSISVDYNTPELAKLIAADDVQTLLYDEMMALVDGTYISHSWKSFRVQTDNIKAVPIFDRLPNTNTTTDPNAKIYVYNDYVPAPPEKPTSPQILIGDSNTIRTIWQHPASDDTEQGFHVLDQFDNIIGTVGPDVFSLIETNLAENTTYFRKVVSFNQYGVSDPSITVSATTPRTLPLAPSDLLGIPLSDTKIKWTWADNSFNEDSFELITWDGGGKVVVIATINPDVNFYEETGLTPSTAYIRAVRAVNTVGSSPNSNVYQATTKEEQGDPPQEAPVNFYGVGVSDSKIYWYWTDISNAEEAFELMDKNDQVIATIPANANSFLEENLISSMFYHRKIRAINKWGNGPTTNLIAAKTLGEGSSYEGVPNPPYNLGVDVLSLTSARIYWSYDDSPVYPAEGFHLYTSEGLLVTSFLPDAREFTFVDLQPNTTYRWFLVAYNAKGNSMRSNTITFVTPHPAPPEPEPETPRTEEEEFADVYYDEETPETGKISAFQSGVGDQLDLKVSNIYPSKTNLERFSYTIFVKGYYDEILNNYYPQVDFRFRIITTGKEVVRIRKPDGTTVNTYQDYYDATDWIVASVNGDAGNGRRDLEYPISKGMLFNIEEVVYRVEVEYLDGDKVLPKAVGEDLQWYIFSSADSPVDTSSDSGDFMVFSSNKSVSKSVTKEWVAPIAEGGPLEVVEGSETHFVKHIRAAHLNYGWQDSIYGYKVVVTSKNPNVEIMLEHDIVDFTPTESTLIEVKLKARIINPTQTLWYPSIHSGYYYLNQQEHYLYVDDRVTPKDGVIDETFVLQFPYLIKAYGKRWHADEDVFFQDTTKTDFLQGVVNGGLSFDSYIDSMTLASGSTKAAYVSKPFWFGNPITSWHTIDVAMDDQSIADGAKVKIEVVRVDDTGRYSESDWIEQVNHQAIAYPISQQEPVERVRYRLTLESGNKKRDYNLDLHQTEEILKTSYAENITVSGDAVTINNVAKNPEGLLITDPIDLGTLINTLGRVTLQLDTPFQSGANFYSVMGTSEIDPSFYDRTKWSRLEEIVAERTGNQRTFDIRSAYTNNDGNVDRSWIAIIVELTRGSTESRTSITLNATNFDASLGVNLMADGNGIKLTDPTKEGSYKSKAAYIGEVSRFELISVSLLETYEDDEIFVDTVTGVTQADVENLSRIESQWRPVIGGVIQSLPKPWMMYRIRIVPGKTNRRVVGFKDNTGTEWNSHSIRTNVDIVVDNVDDFIQLTNARMQGSYQSEQFNLGFQDRINDIKVKADSYSQLTMSISYKVDNVWREPVQTPMDANGIVVPAQNGATGLRYTLELKPIIGNKIVTEVYTESKLRTGATLRPNVQINPDGSVQLVDPSATSDVYTSPTFDAIDVIQYKTLTWDEVIPPTGNIIVEVATSDVNNNWTNETWVHVADDGTIPVPKKKYLRFRATLIGDGVESAVISNIKLSYDSVTYTSPKVYSVEFDINQYDKISPVVNSVAFNPIHIEYHSSTVSNIHLKPSIYAFVKVMPVVHSVAFGGHVAEGYTIENYIVPMTGEIITDGKVRDITNRITEEVVRDYISTQGGDNSDSLSFTDYLLDWDTSLYPVELVTSTNGREPVKAKSTANVGEVLYRNIKIYFDAVNRGVLLKPIPQSGSPIMVKNASGGLLRQVHFRDSNNLPTLTNLEELVTNESRYLFLEYRGIDIPTLEVYVDLKATGEWTTIVGSTVDENRILLPNYFKPGLPVKVLYKLKDSFFVDWNYAPSEDTCLIRVNTPFSDEAETRRLEIRYEVDGATSYYLAKELNLNPLKTRLNAGFIYLTDKIDKPFKIELECNPNVLYKNREDRVTINARVVDQYGNPLVGRRVTFTTNKGTIRNMDSSFTDENGMVTAVFTTAGMTDLLAEYAEIIAMEESTKITEKTKIYFAEEQFTNKLAIVSEKNAVTQKDVVKLKVIATNTNGERVQNRSIHFQIWREQELAKPKPQFPGDPQGGTPDVDITGTTDVNGEFIIFYQMDQGFITEDDSYVLAKAIATDHTGREITEFMLISVSVFRRTLEAPLITATLN